MRSVGYQCERDREYTGKKKVTYTSQGNTGYPGPQRCRSKRTI